MTPLRKTVVLFGVTAAIPVVALVGAATFTHDDASGSPDHTVRDFLVSTVAERDGFDACTYVTRRALAELHAVERPGMICEAELGSYARLTLGGETIDTEAAVKALDYRDERESGGRIRVTVCAHGDGRTFVLRRATRRERDEFAAPLTPWRVDAGVNGLVAR